MIFSSNFTVGVYSMVKVLHWYMQRFCWKGSTKGKKQTIRYQSPLTTSWHKMIVDIWTYLKTAFGSQRHTFHLDYEVNTEISTLSRNLKTIYQNNSGLCHSAWWQSIAKQAKLCCEGFHGFTLRSAMMGLLPSLGTHVPSITSTITLTFSMFLVPSSLTSMTWQLSCSGLAQNLTAPTIWQKRIL